MSQTYPTFYIYLFFLFLIILLLKINHNPNKSDVYLFSTIKGKKKKKVLFLCWLNNFNFDISKIKLEFDSKEKRAIWTMVFRQIGNDHYTSFGQIRRVLIMQKRSKISQVVKKFNLYHFWQSISRSIQKRLKDISFLKHPLKNDFSMFKLEIFC